MEIELTRRKVITVGAVGAGAVAFASSPASAELSVQFTQNTVEKTVSSSTVAVEMLGNSYVEMSWSGFDSPPEPDVQVDVRGTTNGWTPSDTTAKDNFTSFQHELSGSYLLSTTYTGISSTSGNRTASNGTELLFSDLFSETFPFDIVAAHDGMSGDQFVNDTDGQTRTIELEYYLRMVTDTAQDDTYSGNAGSKNPQSISITYDSGGLIEGTVYKGGTPINGAVIYALGSGQSVGEAVASTTSTTIDSSDGRFQFSNLDATQQYHLIVEYDDGSSIYTTFSKPFIDPA